MLIGTKCHTKFIDINIHLIDTLSGTTVQLFDNVNGQLANHKAAT